MRGGAFVDNLTKEQIKEVILENFAGKDGSQKKVQLTEIKEQLSYYEYEQATFDKAVKELESEGLIFDIDKKVFFKR